MLLERNAFDSTAFFSQCNIFADFLSSTQINRLSNIFNFARKFPTIYAHINDNFPKTTDTSIIFDKIEF